ncbi:MAG TPA: DUF302 domain-containing protein [Candidatus Angelobacter sp.]|jgi:uncharacterized protein (DUF302 family)|nr:DUF302 domain-containing protein [Candidatus Angelobacter sp.]
MTDPGTPPIEGIVHRPSPLSVAATVERLTEAIAGAGATLFAVIDHSGEAERAGLSLRDTKLLIFGNPRAGTPLMQAATTAALDLPLKVLVWAADDGQVWMTFLDPAWLAARHHLDGDLAKPLSAPDALTARIAGSA